MMLLALLEVGKGKGWGKGLQASEISGLSSCRRRQWLRGYWGVFVLVCEKVLAVVGI